MSEDAPNAPRALKHIAVSERPQEKMQKDGVRALGDSELLAMILRSGTKGMNVLEVSRELLNRAGSLSALISWTAPDFRRVKGIGNVRAMQLVVAFDVARRIREAATETAGLFKDASAVFAHMAPRLDNLEVEQFWVLCLNRKNRLIKALPVTSGTATSSLVHPREVFREAIRESAAAVICVHNHPSGDPAPSTADIQVTRQLREAARAVDVELHDHVIIGRVATDPAGRGWFSFRSAGML
jgi:DNA repair protein RadC